MMLVLSVQPALSPAPRVHPRLRCHSPRMVSPLVAAADGDTVALLELASLSLACAFGASAAVSLVKAEAQQEGEGEAAPREARERLTVEVDLGAEGEPAGVTRLVLSPRLDRSDVEVLSLPLPLGLLVEEREGAVVVTGTLPGYSAHGAVGEGDVLRAVSAYARVVGGAPMWRQVASGTPLGARRLRRLLFRADGATYAEVREAIASHRRDAGGNGVVSLVLERAVGEGKPLSPRVAPPPIEPLQDVVARDLNFPSASDS
ncbi:hypothetical protein AB1Y20_021132 [Prymnesium parvum]|uniref:Uncharacterized protein n=1 Tax=Prymnesium parvum TaxID=97485 RepID=A0AB34JKN9_PRYPA